MSITNPKSDYFWTSVASGWTMLMNAMVYYFLVRTIGESGFSEFVIGRRAISLISVLLFLGMGVGLPRELAKNRENKTDDHARLLATIYLVIPGLIISSILLWTAPDSVTHIIFGESGHSDLAPSLGLFLWGLTSHGLFYSYLRGLLNFRTANLLSAFSSTCIPLALLLAETAEDLFVKAGLFLFLSNVLIAMLLLSRSPLSIRRAARKARKLVKPLAYYGLPRVPGDITLEALMVTPLIVSNYRFGVEIGSYVAFALVFLNLTNAALSPIGVVLLPRVTMILRTRGYYGAKGEIRNILVGTTVLSIAATISIVVFARTIIFDYLAIEDERAVIILRLICLSIFPFAIFSALKNVIDAAYSKPLNSFNIYLAFFVYSAVAIATQMLLGNHLTSFIVAIPVSLTSLGVFSFVTWKKVVREH